MNSKLTVGGASVLVGATSVVADLSAGSKLFVASDASFSSRLFVNSNTSLNRALTVTGTSDLLGAVNIGTSISKVPTNMYGTATIFDKLTVGDNVANILPETQLWGTLNVGDSTSEPTTHLYGKLIVEKDASFNGSHFFVDGDSSFNGNLQIADNKSLIARALNIYDLSVNHTLQAKDLYINGPQYNGTAFNNSISTLNGDINIVPASPTDIVHIRGGLTVDGSINFIGQYIQNNVVINITEALDISNNGTATTLNVTQNGSQAIATFNDNTGTVMYVDYTGKVGIGGDHWDYNHRPSAELDVSGNSLFQGNVTYLRTLADTLGYFSVTDGNITTKGLTVNTSQASFQQGITVANGIDMTSGNLVLTSGAGYGFVDQSDGTW